MLRIYEFKPGPDPRTLPGYYHCLAVVPFRKCSLAIVPRDQAPRNFYAAFLIDRMTEKIWEMIIEIDRFSIAVEANIYSNKIFSDTYERAHGTEAIIEA